MHLRVQNPNGLTGEEKKFIESRSIEKKSKELNHLEANIVTSNDALDKIPELNASSHSKWTTGI